MWGDSGLKDWPEAFEKAKRGGGEKRDGKSGFQVISNEGEGEHKGKSRWKVKKGGGGGGGWGGGGGGGEAGRA